MSFCTIWKAIYEPVPTEIIDSTFFYFLVQDFLQCLAEYSKDSFSEILFHNPFLLVKDKVFSRGKSKKRTQINA